MSRRRRKAQKGDLKAAKGLADLDLGASGYETAVVQHIPYGPGWDARRIETLVYKQVKLPPSFLSFLSSISGDKSGTRELNFLALDTSGSRT